MSKFYTAFGFLFNQMYISGYENGVKFNRKIDYKPFLFVPSSKGEYRSVKGQPLKRVDFSNISDAREFTKRYQDVINFEIFGLTNYPYVHVYENYKDIQSDFSLIRIGNVDIETDSQNGFGDIQLANREIISITLKVFGEKDIYVVGRKPYKTKEPELLQMVNEQGYKIHYKQCDSEKQLLDIFIQIWRKLNLDIITNWNGESFDIPYIIKRIMQTLSEEHAKKLSPYNKIEKSEYTMWGKVFDKFDIVGIPNIDYMQAYKKFSFTNEESYSLGYIAGKVLKAGKLDYSEYGSLAKLWSLNHDKFIDYNIIDVLRVEQLDDFLKFMQQIVMIAHFAKVNFVDTFGTIRTWDIMIHNYLMDQQICVPQSSSNEKSGQIAGGFVKNPIPGKYNYVMSYDLTSLYPHLFMMYNISPETLLGKFDPIVGEYSVDKILRGEMEQYHDDLVKHNCTVSGKGTVFSREKIGFLPKLMKDLFAQRKQFKNKLLDQEQLLQDIKKELASRQSK